MRKPSIFLFAAIMVLAGACSQGKPGDLVLVKGGTFINTKSNYFGKGVTPSDFYIGRYEVTQKEWVEVMGSNPSTFKGDDSPVETVSWYDCVEFCDKKSVQEGLQPYYAIDKNKKDPRNRDDHDDMKWTVTINAGANGYRLPTEAEWEYAAGGGRLSKSYAYSGSDTVDEVAWYWKNSGDKPLEGFWNYQMIQANNDKTKPVGAKKPNELGLYDMSGNVREWCWDWYGDALESGGGSDRVWKGGGWLGIDQPCMISFRGHAEAFQRYNDNGFRLCRSK